MSEVKVVVFASDVMVADLKQVMMQLEIVNLLSAV
jgi:hypothetical protein